MNPSHLIKSVVLLLFWQSVKITTGQDYYRSDGDGIFSGSIGHKPVQRNNGFIFLDYFSSFSHSEREKEGTRRKTCQRYGDNAEYVSRKYCVNLLFERQKKSV